MERGLPRDKDRDKDRNRERDNRDYPEEVVEPRQQQKAEDQLKEGSPDDAIAQRLCDGGALAPKKVGRELAPVCVMGVGCLLLAGWLAVLCRPPLLRRNVGLTGFAPPAYLV